MQEVVDQFYNAYLPIKAEFDLLLDVKMKLGEETVLEVYRYDNDVKKRVIYISDNDKISLWRRGLEEITKYAEFRKKYKVST